MMRHKVVVILALIALTLVACESKKSLSRTKAKDILQASKQFAEIAGDIRLTDAEIRRGTEQRYWVAANSGVFIFGEGPSLNFTAKGKQIFESYARQSGETPPRWINEALKPLVTEVTGITDTGQNEKTVAFNWTVDSSKLPPDIRPIFKDHPVKEGVAVFRLFDDGWRLEMITSH
jgi:hypothetical protein